MMSKKLNKEEEPDVFCTALASLTADPGNARAVTGVPQCLQNFLSTFFPH